MDNKQLLKKRIEQIELQIKRLSQSTSSNEVSESLHNSLILQKAILKKDLENLNKNPLVEKIKKIMPHQEKLICDYFN
ncbi:MAG: hypothetical protein E7Z92_07115 [Cyanobacteria bacterium SIG31]|nr:hypothetical protein [Cyanobacteria bacterium SIG31]